MKQKILIADDDPDILEAMHGMLDIFGYETDIVSSGAKVMEKIKDFQPNLVLLDIWMSGINGVDICKQIKKNDKNHKLPVIFISASSNIKNETKRAGAVDFIAKPFDMNDLLQKIQTYTKNTNKVD